MTGHVSQGKGVCERQGPSIDSCPEYTLERRALMGNLKPRSHRSLTEGPPCPPAPPRLCQPKGTGLQPVPEGLNHPQMRYTLDACLLEARSTRRTRERTLGPDPAP